MPVRKTVIPPTVWLVHKGVTIYRVYEEDDADRPTKYLFSLDPNATSDDDLAVMDVRNLSTRFITDEPLSAEAEAANLKMDIHEFRRSPYWLTHVEAWERWLNVTQPALCLEVLVDAIDTGTLTP